MRLSTEEQQKKCIASKQSLPAWLLFGSDPGLIRSFRRRLCDMLTGDLGCELERMDGRSLDLPALYDAARMVSFFGGRRLILVDDFEAESLSSEDCGQLCELLSDLSDDVITVFSTPAGSFDIKKGKNAKKLLPAFDKAGAAVQLDSREPASLKPLLRSRCKKRGCDLSSEAAAFLTERCGSDTDTLLNECDKLCAYAGGGPITIDMITLVCPGALSADPFALSRLMLRGDLAAALGQIDALIRLRQPVVLITSNISSAFCSLARACAAKSAGRLCEEFAKDFGFRYQWMAQNAFRDSARLTQAKAFEICEIFSDAETRMKSAPLDERILLETAVVSSMRLLGGVR